MEHTKKFTTCLDGTSVSIGTELIRKSDGRRFTVEEITKEAGKGRYSKVTIVAKGRGETLSLSRQDLEEFQVNLSTVRREDEWYESYLDEEYLADPDDYMRKKEEEEIKILNFRYDHRILDKYDIARAKALGLSWASWAEEDKRSYRTAQG